MGVTRYTFNVVLGAKKFYRACGLDPVFDEDRIRDLIRTNNHRVKLEAVEIGKTTEEMPEYICEEEALTYHRAFDFVYTFLKLQRRLSVDPAKDESMLREMIDYNNRLFEKIEQMEGDFTPEKFPDSFVDENVALEVYRELCSESTDNKSKHRGSE